MQSNQVTLNESNGEFYLSLPQFKRPKRIAELQGRVLLIHKIPNKHTYENYGSIGINRELLNNYVHLFNLIKIFYGEKVFEVIPQFFLECGKFVHFKDWDAQMQIKIIEFQNYDKWYSEIIVVQFLIKN